MTLRNLPWRKKLYVYAVLMAASLAAIAWFSFTAVTLRKAFDLASPWETLGLYLAFTGSLIVVYRACGFHRS